MKGKITKVDLLDDRMKIVKTFETIGEAARSVNRANSSLGQAIRNRTRCGGYRWQYHQYNENDLWFDHPTKPIKVSVSGMIQYPSGRKTFGFKNGEYFRCSFGSVHRIVAETFCPKIEMNDLVVDHINNIKFDNHASNLQWCTKAYNNQKEGLRQRNNKLTLC